MDSVVDTIVANQRAASDPASNVWVNASAGSGKTKVLIDRLLRLLLIGSTPKSILCITFTQAAAIEMRHRLQSVLEQWVILPQADLVQQLQQLDPNLSISNILLTKARQLYNQVLDEPVQIETIHSFAQTILANAYPESNIPYGATLMDDVTMLGVIKKAVAHILDPTHLSAELRDIYNLFSMTKFTDVVEKIRADQAFFRFLLIDGVKKFQLKLQAYLRFPRDETEIFNEAVECLVHIDLPTAATDELSDSDQLLTQRLSKAVQSKKFEPICDIVLTDKGTPRKRLLSKKVSQAYPEFSSSIIALADSVFEWDQEIKRGRTLKTTMLVMRLAEAFLKQYTELKHEKGFLDYDDLIFKTIGVLSDPSISQNILYKFDRIIDHILVDEAQDTNIYQWKLIDYIVDSFFQNETHKTLFVVGDHKQAIFGFQGTDPDTFHQIKDYYRRKPSMRAWKDISLDISFRSLQAILDFVDKIFQNHHLIENYAPHTAFHGDGGKVFVHPLCTAGEDASESDVYARFAEQIVGVIQQKIGSKALYKGNPHVIQPKDILVLIRKRGDYLADLQRELTKHQVPFSSPNRQSLHEDQLVQFILQTIIVITQPRDEATLMQWALNPLLGMGSKAIQWAIQRLTQQQELNSFVSNDLRLESIRKSIEMYTSLEDLYMKILIWSKEHLPIDHHHIQNALILLDLLKTLKSHRGLDLSYSEVLNYVKSLQTPQVNRTDRDALRILTVHGAKGLQAPIVMFVDTTQLPISRGAVRYDEPRNVFLCVSKRKDESLEYDALKTRQKQKELTEYYRLLYVALTRAEHELHVFGTAKTKASDESWYSICSAAMICP